MWDHNRCCKNLEDSNCFEKLYSNKSANFEEMDWFWDTYELPKLTQEDRNILINPRISKEIDSVIMNVPTKKAQGLIDSLLNSTKPLMVLYQ